jgi:outer membrane lipoprotein-sorting protein
MKHILLLFFLLANLTAFTQDARAILERTQENLQGASVYAELEIEIIREDWTRRVELNTWSLRGDYALVFVTAPERERGTAFIKNQEEVWNYQPNIDRAIKLPTSMMMQSWMGSDFSNDFLLQKSSILDDYVHTYEGKEQVSGRQCHKITLIPRSESDIIWGRIETWIDVKEDVQLKTAFFDEDGLLVNTVIGKEIKPFDGKMMPSVIEIEPADGDGEITRVRYKTLSFRPDIDPSLFTVEHVKSML